MKIKEESIVELFKKKSTFKKSLNHTSKFYRQYDPGLFLYKLLLNFSGEFLCDEHIELIYTTLIAWNMNSRGAKLCGYNKFRTMLLKKKDLLQELRTKYIEKLSNEEFVEVSEKIKKLYFSLKISDTKTQLISFSKTIHFLLPNLVMPIDRKYTLSFFYNKTNVNYKSQYYDYCEIQKVLHCVSLRYKLSDYLDQNWNLNIPKTFDNAIIGFVRTHN